jgi:transposase
MSGLILPSHIAADYAYEQARKEFSAQLMEEVDRRMLSFMREFDRRLARIDPELRLIYWDSSRPDMPLEKGFWYIVRGNDDRGIPPTFLKIHADGQPCVPTSRCFEMLAQGDLWNTDLVSRTLARQREELARDERDRMRADEERREHLRDLVNAATRVSVSMTDKPWLQNQDGRARAAGEQRRARELARVEQAKPAEPKEEVP